MQPCIPVVSKAQRSVQPRVMNLPDYCLPTATFHYYDCWNAEIQLIAECKYPPPANYIHGGAFVPMGKGACICTQKFVCNIGLGGCSTWVSNVLPWDPASKGVSKTKMAGDSSESENSDSNPTPHGPRTGGYFAFCKWSVDFPLAPQDALDCEREIMGRATNLPLRRVP